MEKAHGSFLHYFQYNHEWIKENFNSLFQMSLVKTYAYTVIQQIFTECLHVKEVDSEALKNRRDNSKRDS